MNFSIVSNIILLILFCSCTYAFAQNNVHFKEVSHQSGIRFEYTFGDDTYENILESSGSGVSILDYNNDGHMDIFLLNGTYLEGISDPKSRGKQNASNKLYQNDGDGTFTEVSQYSGLDYRGWSMAAAPVDYDYDGDTDIFLLNYGPNVFYRNNSNGTFSDITGELNLEGPNMLNGFTKWSVGAAFWDYNRDGRLDVMVGNFLAFDPDYVSPTHPDMMPHPSEYKGQPSLFYEQQRDGSFKDITKELGLYHPDSKCMGLTVFDYDDDGDMDIFQGNDHQKNFLFQHDGSGNFKEMAIASGVAVNSQGAPTGSMHATIGDVDGDGLIDILVTDLKYGALYRNLGGGFYEDITERSGIAKHFSGKGQWGASLFDYDNDGDLDIFVANGTAEELVLQYPLLLENDGKGNFSNAGIKSGEYFNTKRSGRGVAIVDYDNDGDMDIMVSHVDLQRTPALLRNDGGNTNNWLGLKLLGTKGQADAIGAKVVITAGDLQQTLVNQWATSYLSYNDPRMHVGLGKRRQIDSIKIRWPDGTTETIRNISTNQYITIQKGKGVLTQ